VEGAACSNSATPARSAWIAARSSGSPGSRRPSCQLPGPQARWPLLRPRLLEALDPIAVRRVRLLVQPARDSEAAVRVELGVAEARGLAVRPFLAAPGVLIALEQQAAEVAPPAALGNLARALACSASTASAVCTLGRPRRSSQSRPRCHSQERSRSKPCRSRAPAAPSPRGEGRKVPYYMCPLIQPPIQTSI
jgi:hypothetical protein